MQKKIHYFVSSINLNSCFIFISNNLNNLKNIIFFQIYLPQFIGELNILKNLHAADNILVNIPRCRSLVMLKRLELTHTFFDHPNYKNFNHLLSYNERTTEPSDIKPLSHIALFKLMENFPLINRQDIPRRLWEYFEYVSRCVKCRLGHHQTIVI